MCVDGPLDIGLGCGGGYNPKALGLVLCHDDSQRERCELTRTVSL